MENRKIMKLFLNIHDIIVGAGQLEFSAFAASSAFFLFLSLIPILMLVCAFIPYTGISQNDLLTMVHESIEQIAPGTVTTLIDEVIRSIFAGGALSLGVSALITLWTAGKAFLALMRGMDVIHQEGRQNYFIARIKSCFYTLLIIIVILFLLVGVVFARIITDFIGTYIPSILPIMQWILSKRFIIAWLILTCVFTGIYTWVPKKKLRLTEQIPGAIFSAGAWIGFSALFSVYVNRSTTFGIYGSLATIVIALIWMYYCMYILLLGTYLNVKRNDF